MDGIDSRNPFVQNAVHAAVLFLSGLALSCPPSSDTSSATDATQFPFTTSSCKVIILGDNDFYTQSSLHPPPFASFNHPISQVHKTGLGSSAAMTTSLVGALLHFLCPAHLLSKTDRHALHNVAQFAHAAAQGKVGSGFDVSSAVFGTHQYTRFDPQLLKELLDRPLDEVCVSSSAADDHCHRTDCANLADPSKTGNGELASVVEAKLVRCLCWPGRTSPRFTASNHPAVGRRGCWKQHAKHGQLRPQMEEGQSRTRLTSLSARTVRVRC